MEMLLSNGKVSDWVRGYFVFEVTLRVNLPALV